MSITDEQFNDLYKAHYKLVYNICLKLLGTHEDAEDMCADVFMQVFKHFDNFKGKSKISTWLFRIAKNQCLMKFRRPQHRKESTTLTGEMPEGSTTPNEFQRYQLQEAVEQLAPCYKSAFNLHDVEGREHNEIAIIRGINQGTSKSNLFKGRLRLRQLLNKTI